MQAVAGLKVCRRFQNQDEWSWNAPGKPESGSRAPPKCCGAFSSSAAPSVQAGLTGTPTLDQLLHRLYESDLCWLYIGVLALNSSAHLLRLMNQIWLKANSHSQQFWKSFLLSGSSVFIILTFYHQETHILPAPLRWNYRAKISFQLFKKKKPHIFNTINQQ